MSHACSTSQHQHGMPRPAVRVAAWAGEGAYPCNPAPFGIASIIVVIQVVVGKHVAGGHLRGVKGATAKDARRLGIHHGSAADVEAGVGGVHGRGGSGDCRYCYGVVVVVVVVVLVMVVMVVVVSVAAAAPATVSLGTGIDRCNRQKIKIVVVVVFFVVVVVFGEAMQGGGGRIGGGSCVVCVGAASCWRKVKRRCASHPLPPEADCRSPAQPTQMTSATSRPTRCRTIHPPPQTLSLSLHIIP